MTREYPLPQVSFLDALTSILSDDCGESDEDTNARLRSSAALVR